MIVYYLSKESGNPDLRMFFFKSLNLIFISDKGISLFYRTVMRSLPYNSIGYYIGL